jgi:cell division septal protein FtsQ
VRPLATYGLLAALVVYGLYRGGHVIAHARALQVHEVDVRGNRQLSKKAVVAVLDGLMGENILLVDLEVWRQTLRRSPWVKDASLRRVLPSTIEVSVQEREPVGLGRIDNRLFLVDAHGVLIDEYGPQYASVDLPIVDGLQVSKKKSEPAADPIRAELAARLIRSIRADPDVGNRLSQVDVSDSRNARVMLSGDPTLLFVGNDRFLERVRSYLELAETMNEHVQGIDSVDLRFDNRVYVRVAGKTTRRPEVMPVAAKAPPAKIGATDGLSRER